MNPDKATLYRRKLVSSARAILAYEVGLPLGSTRMWRALVWLGPYESLDYPVFDEYRRATTALPTGQDRLRWDREALRKLDVQLEAINHKFRDRIFEACYGIVDRFESSDEDSGQAS